MKNEKKVKHSQNKANSNMILQNIQDLESGETSITALSNEFFTLPISTGNTKDSQNTKSKWKKNILLFILLLTGAALTIHSYFNKGELCSSRKLELADDDANDSILLFGKIIQLIGTILAWDPTGIMIKLAQMIKIISRFRYLDVSFGNNLEKFIQSTETEFDTDQFQRDATYLLFNGKTRGKLTHKRVPAFYFSATNYFRPLVYMTLWCLKTYFHWKVIPRLKRKFNGQHLLKSSQTG